MGQAKRRGSFEQRKAEGIERLRLEAIERQRQFEERARDRAKREAQRRELEAQRKTQVNSYRRGFRPSMGLMLPMMIALAAAAPSPEEDSE